MDLPPIEAQNRPPTPPGWFCDANLIPLGKALSASLDNIWYPGSPGSPVTSTAVPDDEWLPIVGAAGWAVITRDKMIRRRPGEVRALVGAGVRAFVLTGAGQPAASMSYGWSPRDGTT